MRKQPAHTTSFFGILFFLFIILLVVSCGGRPMRSGSSGGGQNKGLLSSVDEDASSEKEESRSYKKRSFGGGKRDRSDDQKPESPKPAKPTTRIVIYHGYYTVTVESVPVALKEARELAKKFGGYLESASTRDRSRRATIQIRVPVARFNDALKACEKLGEVVSREVRARDITREFQDTRLRLNSHRMVLKRMRELLKKTKKVEERVKILREIERLTAKIETLTRRLNYLKRQASYSTIVLTLKARVAGTVRGYIPSAFHWIAGLKPERRSIYDDGDDIEASAPGGFFNNRYAFFNRKRNVWLYTLPRGGAGIRLGAVKNEPKGSLEFWKKALKIELENRKYKFTAGSLGSIEWFRIALLDKSIYEVYVTRGAKYIGITEILYDKMKTADKLKTSIHGFVKTVRVK